MSAVVVTSENLADFNADFLGIDKPEPAAATEKVEPAVESATDAGTVDAGAEANEQHGKSTDSEGKPKVHLRFSELTEQRKQAEADAAKAREEAKADRERADLAERQAAELRAKYEPPKPDELGPEPKREQFTNDGEFALALKDWAGESAIRDRDRKDASAKIERAWNERQAAVRAELPDYDAVLAAGANLVVSNEVRDAIVESEQGPKILHHLAKNPDLVEELKRLPARSAILRIGKLDAKFEAEKPKTATVETKVEAKPAAAVTEISRAPAPINPLKGSEASTAGSSIDSNGVYHGTYADYKAKRKAGLIK